MTKVQQLKLVGDCIQSDVRARNGSSQKIAGRAEDLAQLVRLNACAAVASKATADCPAAACPLSLLNCSSWRLKLEYCCLRAGTFIFPGMRGRSAETCGCESLMASGSSDGAFDARESVAVESVMSTSDQSSPLI